MLEIDKQTNQRDAASMNKNSKIYVAGHIGLVGSAIRRQLQKQGFSNIVVRTRDELELMDYSRVKAFFEKEKPEYVFLAAAKVGGIRANSEFPAEFIYENLQVQNNVVHNAYLAGVKKLCFLGSSCIYPKMAPQPIKEEYFLDGKLEPTNDAYAVAKIAGIKMCQAYNKQYGTHFVSVMPTNLYGPGDNFDLLNSHVLPALLRKFIEAKDADSPSVTVWGTGKPKREFMFVDDLADACIFVMERYDSSEIINIGTGEDVSIADLAGIIKEAVGFRGALEFDSSMPDGTPRKLLDVGRLNSLGWKARTNLKDGIAITLKWIYSDKSAILHGGK